VLSICFIKLVYILEGLKDPLDLLLKFIWIYLIRFIIYTLEIMEATMAYQRLKQIFPHHLENINLFQLSSKDID